MNKNGEALTTFEYIPLFSCFLCRMMPTMFVELLCIGVCFILYKPNVILENKTHKEFPPIKPGTLRAFVVNCGNRSVSPNFINAEVTLARCEIMDGRHCHEAPYILDFLINWYDNLTEETVVFSHHHTKSWHIKNITEDVEYIRHTDYFKNETYGGFKKGVWKWQCDLQIYQDIYSYMFNETSLPRVWTRFGICPCCATFFVKTEQIRKRPKEEYIQIYKNLEKWVSLNPYQFYYCGRFFEFTWHLILANKNEIPRPGKVSFKYSNFNSTDPCKFKK